ncbi:putative ribonuclease H protein [Vitis vinifera]|uniref:Putative ribonuclease H protein n=1 Tax=Vitis vinifera TaxID=29760 RepID=A0A438GP96_VITVI|nr:putative ribonuclease H protein [Vitis vinifera]
MSLFRMPKIVVRRLEKLQRDFLWGGGNMERKIHLVKWEIVCGDRERGGLGLRKLGLLNRALLGKWIWRFACERENLWKQVIVAKFGQKMMDGKFMVGKDTKIRFWTDVWCAGTALSQTFPHLFALAANRNATVEEMWDQNSDQGGWILRFLRNFNDWEVGMVGDLLLKLRGLGLLWRKIRSLGREEKTSLSLRGGYMGEEESVNHVLIHCIVARALWELVLGLVGVKVPMTTTSNCSHNCVTQASLEEVNEYKLGKAFSKESSPHHPGVEPTKA